MARGPGVTADATRWLFEQGVRVMGIDAWGWDRPLHLQAQEAIERGEAGIFWAAHQADLPYSQIERLANLGALPSTGLPRELLPAAHRRRERGAGARRRHPGRLRLSWARGRAPTRGRSSGSASPVAVTVKL